MGFQSNYREFARDLAELEQAFSMCRRTSAGRLGDTLALLTAQVIHDRTMIRKLDPENTPLAELKPSTIKRKVQRGFPPQIGVETGAMLDLEEIMGEVTVTEDTMIMEYGVGWWEKEKATWFQEGKAHQAPRPFYELGQEGEDQVDGFIDGLVDAAIQQFEA